MVQAGLWRSIRASVAATTLPGNGTQSKWQISRRPHEQAVGLGRGRSPVEPVPALPGGDHVESPRRQAGRLGAGRSRLDRHAVACGEVARRGQHGFGNVDRDDRGAAFGEPARQAAGARAQVDDPLARTADPPIREAGEERIRESGAESGIILVRPAEIDIHGRSIDVLPRATTRRHDTGHATLS